jgi:hypothetical protein
MNNFEVAEFGEELVFDVVGGERFRGLPFDIRSENGTKLQVKTSLPYPT